MRAPTSKLPTKQDKRAASLARFFAAPPRRGRRGFRGFTLIELMVALTMGLIVGVAVVGLSKQVTTTLHEEARVTATESGLRIAMERLRYDLGRASNMSTPNLGADPGAKSAITASATGAYVSGLAGIRIYDQGSTTAYGNSFMNVNPGAAAPSGIPTMNGLVPDAIDITGNLSPGDDAYAIQLNNSSSTPSSCGSGDHLLLSLTDAVYRLAGSDDSAALTTTAFADNMLRTFVPAGTPGKTTFLARIVDRAVSATGTPADQYVMVCNAGYDKTAGFPFVDTATSVIASTVAGSQSLGELQVINPVQTVRWRVIPSPTTGVYAGAGMNPNNDPSKFDLLRTYVDATGAEVGAATSGDAGANTIGEVVAEYIVDLKFRLTVDSEAVGTSPPTPVLSSFPFDDGGTYWAGPMPATYTKPIKTLASASGSMPSPQRVRSVGIRISGRTSMPDRTVDLPSTVGSPYIYRYAIDGGPYGTGFARVRTLMSEVTLINQQTANYP